MPKTNKKRHFPRPPNDINVFTLNLVTGESRTFRDAGLAIVYARRINGNRATPRVVVCVQTPNSFHMV